MKALRYLLIVVAMLSVLSVSAQMLARLPEATMHSTSAMVGSGSNLPSAASSGAVVTGSTPGSYSPASMSGPRHARKAADGDDEDTPPVNPPGPNENPLGDAVLPLMLLAAAYLILRAARKRKSAMSK
ncbi:MAG: hypothetical protein IJ047_00800 [Paludibacteraceae bacterium]|nr:hypothetical protein [Paludibacteraceae bacterium]